MSSFQKKHLLKKVIFRDNLTLWTSDAAADDQVKFEN